MTRSRVSREPGSVARDRPAWGRAAFGLVKVNLQEKLVYRFDLIIGLVRVFILALVFRQLWIVLYGGREAYAGVTLNQTLTYVIMSIAVMPLFPNSLILEVNDRIRSGNILFDITRPMYYGNLLLFQTMGQSLAILITSSLPLFALAWLLLRLALPASVVVWLAFLVSLILGFFIAFLLDFIASLLGFWMTEISGVRFAKWNITDLLGGRYIPLWVFPFPLKQIALCLPFRGISYTPLSILVEEVSLREVPIELGFQIVWIVLLTCLGRLLYAAVVKKLAVQGG